MKTRAFLAVEAGAATRQSARVSCSRSPSCLTHQSPVRVKLYETTS